MAEKPIIMPKMGESIAEATVIRWLKNEGDHVEKDEAIVEIATDKVDSEIPSTESGILVKQLYGEGQVVKVGEPVALINTEGNSAVAAAPTIEQAVEPAPPIPTASEAAIAIESTIQKAAELSGISDDTVSSDRFYSPLVMNIARQEGITMAELDKVPGTGKEGRVTKADILLYVENRTSGIPTTTSVTPSIGSLSASASEASSSQAAAEVTATPNTVSSSSKGSAVTIKAPAISLNAGDEVVEMDRVRKLIADHMVMSKHISPHVTSFVEADVTNLVNWRNSIKDKFKKKEGENITFTPIFMEAIVKAIKDFPMINVSVDGDKIIKRKNINVGMAVAQQNGNLIVPVIKNADTMNLLGLTRAVNDLANRARINKLSPDEIQGGTYTLTNVGSFGNVFGTPVINQPQVAIMAVGAIRKKPAVLETEHGDVIAIRHMMYLSHSYDHRVVDGGLGGMFVRRVADYLEQWDVNREIF
jgi:2-oxoglutarate dehydrogenase E2 component (dihydrolipoamide succinyltransferase)